MIHIGKSLLLGVVIGAALLLMTMAGCAHVAPVVETCAGEVTPGLIAAVGTALGEADYEVAIVKATVGVLPCLVVETVKTVVRSLDENSSVKAALAINPDVVRMHGREWLAVHGHVSVTLPPWLRHRRAWALA